MSTVNEKRVRGMVVRWAQAVASGDREGILAHHAKDMLMYDLVQVD